MNSGFILTRHKKGLFLDHHGFPSTKELEWQYFFELEGPKVPHKFPPIPLQEGTLFTFDKIKIEDAWADPTVENDQFLEIVGGDITVEKSSEGLRMVHISLKISKKGIVQDFEGNGTYKLNKSNK